MYAKFVTLGISLHVYRAHVTLFAQDVKEYIRRAKAWRNREWGAGSTRGKPKSYLLSLLVVKAYNISGGGNADRSLYKLLLSFEIQSPLNTGLLEL